MTRQSASRSPSNQHIKGTGPVLFLPSCLLNADLYRTLHKVWPMAPEHSQHDVEVFIDAYRAKPPFLWHLSLGLGFNYHELFSLCPYKSRVEVLKTRYSSGSIDQSKGGTSRALVDISTLSGGAYKSRLILVGFSAFTSFQQSCWRPAALASLDPTCLRCCPLFPAQLCNQNPIMPVRGPCWCYVSCVEEAVLSSAVHVLFSCSAT